ncbi:unnamed protein product [Cuscuta epithymum]|uniref:Uncharacterized protein n=1 Tax=Cuscuta epithymum TaxID=186058 RepID=A0AAV0EXJ8_9ASTE|nr:unnamed protein product [Cuscuta epithymum]
MQMLKKFHKLLCSSESNSTTRQLCEESFKKLKLDVEDQVGSIYFFDSDSTSFGVSSRISNPKTSRKKDERNVCCKSLIEVKTNIHVCNTPPSVPLIFSFFRTSNTHSSQYENNICWLCMAANAFLL